MSREERQRIGWFLRQQVMKRCRGRCCYCGTHDDLTFDHIRPLSKGGKTQYRNLQVLCRPCNEKKGNQWSRHWPKGRPPVSKQDLKGKERAQIALDAKRERRSFRGWIRETYPVTCVAA